MGARLNRTEQVRYLEERGFEAVRGGKGSHEHWEHPEFQALAAKYKLEIPANLMNVRTLTGSSNSSRIILPSSAGDGTWKKIAKMADWCHEQVTRIKQESAQAQKIGTTARQWREDANWYSNPQNGNAAQQPRRDHTAKNSL